MTERRQDVCPNWQLWIRRGEVTLALCGAKSAVEPLSKSGRPIRCPIYTTMGSLNAFHYPQIVEFVTGEDGSLSPVGVVENADKEGAEGIEQLKKIWDQVVKDFKERHPEK